MKLIKTEGDLLQLADVGYFDAIAHGCNCRVMMGAGIASQIKHKYPQAYAADVSYDAYFENQKDKLGTFSYTQVPIGLRPDHYEIFTLFNLYTQFEGGANFDKEAFAKCCLHLNKVLAGKTLGLPLIGCGIGGGDWIDVNNIIFNYLNNLKSITIVKYAK